MHSGLFSRTEVAPSSDGPGDSGRMPSWLVFPVLGASQATKGAPQSSHVRKDGWLRNVHRGHWNMDSCRNDRELLTCAL